MKQRRVGTFSMGLLLLCTGIGLLYAQFQPALVASSVLKWWPIIFIILGIEVLAQNWLNKGEESKIKYDIFSILIIFFIVMAGIGLHAAGQVGLGNYIQENITSVQYSLQTNHEIALDKNIQKIVIEAENGPRLKVRTGTGDSIQCNARASIRAQSEAQAQQVLQENTQLHTRRDGNTLYLNLRFSTANNCYGTAYSLILPERLAVELEHQDTPLQITTSQITNDWLVRGNGDLDITLAPQSNLTVYAMSPHPLALKGNLNWTTPDGQPLKKLQEEGGAQEEYQDTIQSNQIGINSDQEKVNEATIQAQAKLGSGRYKMTIIHQGRGISINQLP
jgi:hypothetical protein